jgi:arabinan endo-1,5-alpha-L-arabinosidase
MPRAIQAGIRAIAIIAAIASSWPAARAEHFDAGVHDPVMIRADGTYYLFCTGRGVSVFTSTDMRDWQSAGPAFDETPAWTASAVPPRRWRRGGPPAAGAPTASSESGGENEAAERRRRRANWSGAISLWAPDVALHNGTYYLYYSVSSFGSNNSAIGVATNATLDRSDPTYQWVHHGPVVQSIAGRDMFNAIDPNLAFDDDGTPWLAFGSYWSGMKLVRLNENLTEVAEPEEWQTIAARDRYWKLDEADAGNPQSGAIEAPFIFKKDGRYYLFVSWDVCCRGVNSTYKVVVGRSDKITGPYLDKAAQPMQHGGGSLVVGGNEAWPGVGHNSAYTLDGQDYLVFHGYDAADNGRPKLWIQEIEWDADGWPSVSLD